MKKSCEISEINLNHNTVAGIESSPIRTHKCLWRNLGYRILYGLSSGAVKESKITRFKD